MKKPDTIRRMLRATRILRGYDQTQLARATRLKQPDISLYETGRRTPTREAAIRISRVLGTEPMLIFPEIFQAIPQI